MNAQINSKDETTQKSKQQNMLSEDDGWYSRNRYTVILSTALVIVVCIMGAMALHLSHKLTFVTDTVLKADQRLEKIEQKLKLMDERESQIASKLADLNSILTDESVSESEDELQNASDKKQKKADQKRINARESDDSNSWAWYLSIIIIIIIFIIVYMIYLRMR